jgi:hypothetical protein
MSSHTTAEQWWNRLSEAERAAFLVAAKSGELTEETWANLNGAGVPTWTWEYGADPEQYVWPLSHLRYVLDKATEASA